MRNPSKAWYKNKYEELNTHNKTLIETLENYRDAVSFFDAVI